jgi:cyclopropane-fatty-acyl-phospholipid synthase
MMSMVLKAAIRAAERGKVPDPVTRLGIRWLCAQRLKVREPEARSEATEEFLQRMRLASVAELPDEANVQHYEVPSGFFELVLGPALKYSSCYWGEDTQCLAAAEQAALERTCRNARIEDGQSILELGCGWGSLTLYLAARYPNSSVLAVSNSHKQREHILRAAKSRDLNNLRVVTADINEFEPEGTFDRAVSVEMFEHVRNHPVLLERVSHWLNPNGRLLVHLFCTAGIPYAYEDKDEGDWMARNFFSGGIMPSDDLMLRYQAHLLVERQWRWSGRHYQKTLEAWLQNLDKEREQATRVLGESGEIDPSVAIERWRIFLMACSELFGYSKGRQWYVSHYLFRKRSVGDAPKT